MAVSKYLIGAIVALILVAALAGAYFLGKGQLSVVQVSPTPQATTVTQTLSGSSPTPSPAVTSTSDFVNPSATISQIEASVNSKNYAALESYMTDPVNVIIYASSCCGAYTKTQAVQETSGYLKDAKGPWDFSLMNSNSKILVQKTPQYFKDYVIGIATGSRHVVAFHLSDKFLIDKVTLVVDYELITK